MTALLNSPGHRNASKELGGSDCCPKGSAMTCQTACPTHNKLQVIGWVSYQAWLQGAHTSKTWLKLLR